MDDAFTAKLEKYLALICRIGLTEEYEAAALVAWFETRNPVPAFSQEQASAAGFDHDSESEREQAHFYFGLVNSRPGQHWRDVY